MSDEHPPDEQPEVDPTVEIDDDAASTDDAITEPPEAQPERSAPTMSARTEIPFGLIVFLIIAVLLVIFTVQNSSEDVTLKFLAWDGSYPLALIIIAVVAVTVILDEVFGLFLRQRRRKRLAEKQELERLRGQNR